MRVCCLVEHIVTVTLVFIHTQLCDPVETHATLIILI